MKKLATIICTIEEGKKPFARIKIDASPDNLLMGLGALFNSAINKMSHDMCAPKKVVKKEILKFISKEHHFEGIRQEEQK